jgi:hypothetical protein
MHTDDFFMGLLIEIAKSRIDEMESAVLSNDGHPIQHGIDYLAIAGIAFLQCRLSQLTLANFIF